MAAVALAVVWLIMSKGSIQKRTSGCKHSTRATKYGGTGWMHVYTNEQRGQTFNRVNYSNTRPHAVTYPLVKTMF